jgi:hypothetical protein
LRAEGLKTPAASKASHVDRPSAIVGVFQAKFQGARKDV